MQKKKILMQLSSTWSYSKDEIMIS